jgi:hypothetical protein
MSGMEQVKLNIGVPGAQLSVPGAVLARLAKPFGLTPFAELVGFIANHARVYVAQPDQGEITLDVIVANFSLREVRIEDVHLAWVILSTRHMSEIVFRLHRPVTIVPRRKLESFGFVLSLRAPDIRSLRDAIGLPQALNSSGLAIGIQGHCRVASWRGAVWLPLVLKFPAPDINMYVPPASNAGA